MIAPVLACVASLQATPTTLVGDTRSANHFEPAPISLPLVSAMSPDHRRLAVETRDEGVWIFNFGAKTWDTRILPRNPHTIDIAWSTDGSKLALVGSRGPITIANSVTGESTSVLAALPRVNSSVDARDVVAFAAGDDVLVVGLGADAAELWSVSTGERTAVLNAHGECNARPSAFAVSRAGDLVAIGTIEGGVSVWNARSGKLVNSIPDLPRGGQHGSRINGLDFDATGKKLAIAGGDCHARVWSLRTLDDVQVLSHLDADIFDALAIGCVRFNGDGTRLLSISFDFWEARVWNVATERVIDHFDFGGGNPAVLRGWFSSDDSHVVVSLGCRIGRIETSSPRSSSDRANDMKTFPGGLPDHEHWTWYESDGMYAWAVVDGALTVRTVVNPEPLVRIPIAPLPAPAKRAVEK